MFRGFVADVVISTGGAVAGFVLNDFLPYQLAVLSARTSRQFSQVYRARFGISVTQWRVLAHLGQAGGPLSVREIYMRVEMDKSKVSRAATRLVTMGYVQKAMNSADRRLVQLTLSASGRDLIRKLAPLAAAYEQRFLDGLGAQKDAFRAALVTLLAQNSPDDETRR